MAQQASTVSTVTSQIPKSKAKRRYLKAKKERKKKRKALATESRAPTKAREQSAPGHTESESSTESESEDASGGDGISVDPASESATRSQVHEGRPIKRRKLDVEVAETTARRPSGPDGDEVIAKSLRSPSADLHWKSKSPTPPVALPAFPQPRIPQTLSKSVLALQGLDRAAIEAEIVNPATTLPLAEPGFNGDRDVRTGLSSRMRKRLRDLGITELFAVQTAVVPLLLSSTLSRSLYRPYDVPQDLCVSAPTGSGKTLAYVLPIVEVLSARVVTHLRALIVLPTRDLVGQVRETFEAIAKGRGLRVGAATGQHSFAHEQGQLVVERNAELQGGSSKVDILICTPGRLIDHLNGTPNFSLQHLRFLVIDEADRLLAQSFQNWLARVLVATRPPRPSEGHVSQPRDADSLGIARPHPDGLSPAFLHLLAEEPFFRTDIDEKKHSSCQKLLFSATLTRDPAKIAALGLHQPKYIAVQSLRSTVQSQEEGVLDFAMEKFTVPATLTEYMIVCEASVKPLILFYLVHMRNVRNALVFTKSAESTTRLVRLFEFYEAALGGTCVVARAYSSDLAPGERKSILEQFKNQEIHLLMCSDLISRGIDISHVSHVVSYDVPVDFRKYVHRVGRTARAGRAGDAWTLVEEQEARYFKTMLKEADHMERVKRLRVGELGVESMRPAYEVALARLKEVYSLSRSVG